MPDAPGLDGDLLELAPSRRAVVVLVDGLGYDLLRQRSGHAPFLRGLLPAARRLAAGFPSTTATSMGSFGTGLPPGAHGLVGYEVLVPGEGEPGVDEDASALGLVEGHVLPHLAEAAERDDADPRHRGQSTPVIERERDAEPRGLGWNERPEALEAAADALELVLVRLDER